MTDRLTTLRLEFPLRLSRYATSTLRREFTRRPSDQAGASGARMTGNAGRIVRRHQMLAIVRPSTSSIGDDHTASVYP